MEMGDIFIYIRRASEVSETLSGVTQSRFCYIYWRASEASETLIGLNNGNRIYIYIYDTCKTL